MQMKTTGGKSSGSRKTDKVGASITPAADVPDATRFPIVGIGASAGGLEALEVFFQHTPADCGLAFVVIQHLDPTYEDMLPELLQRQTEMPVIRVEDGMRVRPNQVHVIPPNRDLSIVCGVLHLIEQAPGLRLPIDFFFRSLADAMRDASVGVILSGMGTDGTIGVRAIKEQCGVVFVQDPASAKFDSMIQSVIRAGLADGVAPIEELPGRILDYVRQASSQGRGDPNGGKGEATGLEKVLVLLHRQTGHDFSAYKRSTIARRIERRLTLHQFTHYDGYICYLRENPHELELLLRELLIGVTSFFRDDEVWNNLRETVLPELIRQRPEGGELRAWVAGCSTGEEAYSLAMIFLEVVAAVKPEHPVTLQIFATDLDLDAISRARHGLYPQGIANDVPADLLEQFFTREESGFRVVRQVRDMVVFAQQNIASDAPFTKLDLLSCRNLLIYLVVELQRKLLPLFHYCLNPGGFLLLGNAETIGPATDLFVPLAGKARIFRRLDAASAPGRMYFPVAFSQLPSRGTAGEMALAGAPPPGPDLQSLANEFLLHHCTPAAVLASAEGDILYIHGKTGSYLEPAAGKVNWNLFVMAREELNHAVFEAFQRALRKKDVVVIKGIRVTTRSAARTVDLAVHPIKEPPALAGMVMVVFSDSTFILPTETRSKHRGESPPGERLLDMTRSLRHTREELQILREEMQTTGEELKSSNEELQSANEELQSMNEELTTSKEEMQAMNEELQVVNQDLTLKLQDLSRTNNDMKNLLSGTDIATLFLDNTLNVRWFAPQTAEIIHLIATDIGRPVTDLVSHLDYPGLAEDTRQVLRTLTPLKREVPARDGRWYAVRVIPYRTRESMIDGLVITFLDISETRKIADELQACQELLQTLRAAPERNPEAGK
jgi:two-component system, chemotaxis family, CheB/CheR fusion protein